ncbi:MAG TPA: CHRD domain-containing protein [Catenuloplanes sp.]
MRPRRRYAVAASCAIIASALAGGSPANAGSQHAERAYQKTTTVHAKLRELNKSGASGKAQVRVKGDKLDVRYSARGLVRNAPHAVHIHYGEQARHECPTLADDTNRDGRLTTLEGVPAYGPIVVSLTTRGDTSPASGLAVDRFPTAPKGKISYHRHNIKTSADTAKDIRDGEAVLVIHGVDHNHNGRYDFKAGKSELDPKLPAEATNTAACGVLRR